MKVTIDISEKHVENVVRFLVKNRNYPAATELLNHLSETKRGLFLFGFKDFTLLSRQSEDFIYKYIDSIGLVYAIPSLPKNKLSKRMQNIYVDHLIESLKKTTQSYDDYSVMYKLNFEPDVLKRFEREKSIQSVLK